MPLREAAIDDQDVDMIDAYLKHLKRAGFEETSRNARRKLLERLNRELPHGLGEVCRDDLEAWLYPAGRRPRAQNTLASYWDALHSFYPWAADPADPWITEDPTIGMTPIRHLRGEARPVEDDDLWRILAEADEPYRTWAKIAAYQGLRCIEISRLDREHITRARLHVVKGKGGRPRRHDTDPIVWAAVEHLPTGPIARDEYGERLSAGKISISSANYFRRHMKLNATLHMLRHWLGVTAQARYRDIRVTQELLGHVSLSSTQIYTRATMQQQREARATLPRPA